jgi:hypothetical protein
VDDGGLQSDDDSLSDEIVNLSLLSDAGGADTPPPKKGPGDRRASDGVPLENILSEVDDIAKEIGSFDDNLESFLVSEGGGGTCRPATWRRSWRRQRGGWRRRLAHNLSTPFY